MEGTHRWSMDLVRGCERLWESWEESDESISKKATQPSC